MRDCESVEAEAATETATGALRRRRLSLYALVLIVGLGMASWITRTPAIRDSLEASTAMMGLVLFGVSVGSMVGVLSSGPFLKRVGSRPVVFVGTVLVIVGTGIIGAGSALGTPWLVFLGLLVFGLGGGVGEIALNVDAADIETLTGRPVLPYLHGSFSIGTLVGALAGIGMTAIDFPVVWHLVIVVAVLAVIAVVALPGLTPGIGRETSAGREPGAESEPGADGQGSTQTPAPATKKRQRSVWRDPAIMIIGVIALAMAFAEGSANDWLPLLMVDGHGMSATLSSFIYAAFAAMMAVGRFAGGHIMGRFGRALVLRACALLAMTGILLVVFTPNMIVACIGVVLWGLGVSLGFPVAISAAGDAPHRAAERVSAVATSGYLAFLVGPPLLGFIGEAIGLQQAMLFVVGLLVIGVAATLAMGRTAAGGAPSG